MTLEAFKPHLIYWIKSVSGLNGFFSDQKIEAQDNYFVIRHLTTQRKGHSWLRDSLTDDEKTYVEYFAEIMFRIDMFGENSYDLLLKVENSLEGYAWNHYLNKKGLGYCKSTPVKNLTDFSYTEFLNQSQYDVSFNILVSNYNENIGAIETVSANIDDLTVDCGLLTNNDANQDSVEDIVSLEFTVDDTFA